MLQEIIEQRQNDPEMLKCQYAARHYYNAAETWNNAAFVCAIISLLSIFVPEGTSSIYSITILLVPLVFDVASFICNRRMGISATFAALLRNYFDEMVLGIKNVKHTDSFKRKVKSLIIDAVEKNKKEFEEQVSNTGRDNPPGVKNWYEFAHQYTDSEVVFECQKQNCWWNNELCHKRLLHDGIVLLLGIFLGIYFCAYLRVSILRVIFCLISAVKTLAYRIDENVNYIRLSMKIDDYCEMLEISIDQDSISALQEQISKRRELKVFEINRFHKKHSKELSELYEQITKDS